MEMKFMYIIKVLDQMGKWYNNAFIENEFDAIAVAQFYRDELGYFVQLWHGEKDLTALLDSTKRVAVIKK